MFPKGMVTDLDAVRFAGLIMDEVHHQSHLKRHPDAAI